MKGERKLIRYDAELEVEAYRFEGVAQPFPNHFHDYYVIGLLERGERSLSCKNRTEDLRSGDLILFNPGDNHACAQRDGGTLYYRAFNVSRRVMEALTEEITGLRTLPAFSPCVIRDSELACCFQLLHQMVMEGSREFEKEEHWLWLISRLLDHYSRPFERPEPECPTEIEVVCAWIQEHYMEHISLEQLCRYSGLSKSTLLRAFTRSKGITPYRYLETIRISEAKKLLEQGVSPVETALRTGFSDQSHFTNFFSMLIGLTPGAYREIFEHS